MKSKNELLAAIKVVQEAGYEINDPANDSIWKVIATRAGYVIVECDEPTEELFETITVGGITGIYEDYDYNSGKALIKTNVNVSEEAK